MFLYIFHMTVYFCVFIYTICRMLIHAVTYCNSLVKNE